MDLFDDLPLPCNKLGLHQDRDERDPRASVVSLSLGLPAAFRRVLPA